MIHDVLKNWPLYFNAPPWRDVFAYLSSLDAETPEYARFDLQGDDIYASVMSYATCGPQEAKLEAHDVYVDIQMSLVGGEGIDWFPRHVLEVKTPYDPVRDRTLYHRPGTAPARVDNLPGAITVLFPGDAHMPKQIIGDKTGTVKKVVVKLRRALIQ